MSVISPAGMGNLALTAPWRATGKSGPHIYGRNRAVPLTLEKHEGKLHDPALCEELPVRDYLDNVVVRTNGALVAGYELKGLASYFASDEGRDRGKLMLEALLRSLPEQSMRMQFRYEVVEDLGDLLEQYAEAQQSERPE